MEKEPITIEGFEKLKKELEELKNIKRPKIVEAIAEARGIGGIFFDYKMNNWEKDFLFVQDVGFTFAHLVKEIIRKKMFLKWTQKEKETQLLKRGRYAEFNLLYDRGTKFGLNSGGNPEAILMSMPPTARWK